MAARATNLASDKRQAVTMMVEAICNMGSVPREISAHAGYYSAKAALGMQAMGVDPFSAPDQTPHAKVTAGAQGANTLLSAARDRMRQKPDEAGR